MSKDEPYTLSKIIATLGPASGAAEQIAQLIRQGARVFRINFSHGSFDDFADMLAQVRQAAQDTQTYVGVLGDLCGPKLRIGQVVDGGVAVKKGQSIAVCVADRIGGRDQPCDEDVAGDSNNLDVEEAGAQVAAVFSTNSPEVIDDIEPGHRLLINDGAVRTIVLEVRGEGDDKRLICKVTTAGVISSAKGINLPDSNLRVPSLTDYDRQCVQWALANEIDWLALSFVRAASDIVELKELIESQCEDLNKRIPVIAKIEKPQAIDDLDAIVQESDAIMVARGDLGVEMDLTIVPIIQKRIITLARDLGKPVIVATQMLQSMIENAQPTRAEVSDVANALFDGAGAVMLSGETAVGAFPKRAVAVMSQIARKTQAHALTDEQLKEQWARPPRWRMSRRRSAALAFGVRNIVNDYEAKLVVIWSQASGGARFLSAARLSVPIFAMSSDVHTLYRMNMLFGVHPLHMELPESTEAFAHMLEPKLLQYGWCDKGDPYVLVAGEPIGTVGSTNSVSLRYLGES